MTLIAIVKVEEASGLWHLQVVTHKVKATPCAYNYHGCDQIRLMCDCGARVHVSGRNCMGSYWQECAGIGSLWLLIANDSKSAWRLKGAHFEGAGLYGKPTSITLPQRVTENIDNIHTVMQALPEDMLIVIRNVVVPLAEDL